MTIVTSAIMIITDKESCISLLKLFDVSSTTTRLFCGDKLRGEIFGLGIEVVANVSFDILEINFFLLKVSVNLSSSCNNALIITAKIHKIAKNM